MKDQEQIVAWIGVDWADEGHHVFEYNVGTGGKENYAVQHSVETLQQWLSQVRSRYAGKRVAVVVEQARGGLIYSLMNTDFVVIYPVNPQSLAKYRKALYPSGAKSDPADAELLGEMVRQNPERFRAWVPGDVPTRTLQLLTEGRRKLVEDMTALTNQLTSVLKTYYPQALEWAGPLGSEQACTFLEKWPTLMELQKSRPLRLTIENYDEEIERVFRQHPDRVVFESFPGAGKVLAPRLLAAFGADRDRFQTALEVQEFSGIAPVTERSGKAIWVHRRLACPKFLLQTFHEFANCAWRFCAWSKLYYQLQRSRGKDHHAAIRALAYKWIRIMFRCWKERTPYDDSLYVKSLTKRGSHLAAGLNRSRPDSVVENLSNVCESRA